MIVMRLALLILCCMHPLSATKLTDTLLEHVRACIQDNDDQLTIIDTLQTDHAYIEQGDDQMRVKFVGLQGIIEHVLACTQALDDLKDLVGIIHTPMPATPLCIRPNEAPSEGLLDASIHNDPARLLTVQSRAQTVREYLHKGGRLYVAYPHGGLEKRSAEQQAIYAETLAKFPDSLIDWVLETNLLEPGRIGALYLFRDSSGQNHAFSIKSTQANSPQDFAEWGLWLGPVSDPVINDRVTDLCNYLLSIGGPPACADL